MESIIDTILQRNIVVYADDPHTLIFDLIKKLSALGVYDEKKNIYETDGPVKKAHVIFSIVDNLDKDSKIDIAFDMTAQMSRVTFLEIRAEGSLITRFEEPQSVFAETYVAYYLSNVSQEYKRMAAEKMKEADAIIADTVKEFKHAYL